jgi:hypothetical protein
MGEIMTAAGLDYYVVMEGGGRAAAVVVEEFVLAGDHTAAGLASATWTAGGWGPSLSRRMRSDPVLLARAAYATRAGARRRFGCWVAVSCRTRRDCGGSCTTTSR